MQRLNIIRNHLSAAPKKQLHTVGDLKGKVLVITGASRG